MTLVEGASANRIIVGKPPVGLLARGRLMVSAALPRRSLGLKHQGAAADMAADAG
jgi:hypothetical protein